MDNTQIVKQGYERFGSGDIDGLLELFSEDIHWKTPDVNGSPFTSEIHGKDNVREFLWVAC